MTNDRSGTICDKFLLETFIKSMSPIKISLETFYSLFYLTSACNESDIGWLLSAGTSVFRPINLDQLRTVTDKFISGNEDT